MKMEFVKMGFVCVMMGIVNFAYKTYCNFFSWTGLTCAVLNLAPSNPGDGTCESNLNGTARGFMTTWGGSPVLSGSTWTLVVSEMANHCGMIQWGGASQAGLWTSSSITGPYYRKSTVVGVFCHNAWLFPVNSSLYVLFHIGLGCDSVGVHACNYGKLPSCTNGTSPSFHPPLRNGTVPNEVNLHRAHTHFSTSPEGPFLPIPSDWTLPYCANNPTAVFLKNGSMMMMCHTQFEGLTCKPEQNYLYTAVSLTTDWTHGKWVARCVKTLNPMLNTTNGTFSAYNEDPHLFLDQRGNVHALTHNQGPCYSGENASFYGADVRGCGGHMFSTDQGNTWTFTWHAAYNGSVLFRNKQVNSVRYRRERPKLVMNGTRPIALSTAVSFNVEPEQFQPNRDSACTLVTSILK